jgi:hypothetical protein
LLVIQATSILDGPDLDSARFSPLAAPRVSGVDSPCARVRLGRPQFKQIQDPGQISEDLFTVVSGGVADTPDAVVVQPDLEGGDHSSVPVRGLELDIVVELFV